MFGKKKKQNECKPELYSGTMLIKLRDTKSNIEAEYKIEYNNTPKDTIIKARLDILNNIGEDVIVSNFGADISFAFTLKDYNEVIVDTSQLHKVE